MKCVFLRLCVALAYPILMVTAALVYLFGPTLLYIWKGGSFDMNYGKIEYSVHSWFNWLSGVGQC